jgi:hypothetical protein
VDVAQERPRSTPGTSLTNARGTEPPQTDTQSVVQIETDLFRAKMTSDPIVIGKVLAADWVNSTPTGHRWGSLNSWNTCRQHSGELPPYSSRQQDLEVFLLGDTAVATYFEVRTAKPDKNLPWSTLQTDMTDVFVKSAGIWQLRMSRASPHLEQ